MSDDVVGKMVKFDSIESYFNELFTNAITFGMSYNQFWKGKPELYWAYQVAYSNKLDADYEFENYKAWLHGLYFFDAISKSNYNINRQNVNDPVEMYIEKPIDFKELARIDKEEIAKQKRIENDNSIKNMLSSKKSIIEQRK